MLHEEPEGNGMMRMGSGILALGMVLLSGMPAAWAQGPPPLPGQKGSGGGPAPAGKADKNAAPDPETVAVALVSQVPPEDRENLKSYWAGVQARTKDQWTHVLPAAAKPPLSATGQVQIVGWIHTDGRVTGLALEHSSGKAPLDRAALAAINGSVPYAPFPYGIAVDQVKVRFTFEYNAGGLPGAGPKGLVK